MEVYMRSKKTRKLQEYSQMEGGHQEQYDTLAFISNDISINLSYLSSYKHIMQSIGLAKPEHAATIADFQLKMAFETQNIKLNKQLVEKAVEYFLSLSPSGKFSHLGFYLVKYVGQEVVGSLLVTFQTHRKWWIQSVYIKQQHRRRGHFTALFKRAVEFAKENSVDSIKLYAESRNQRAKATYFKLGMHIIEGKFYSYDFVLGSPSNSAKNELDFNLLAQRQDQLAQWIHLKKNALDLKIEQTYGSLVAIQKGKKMVGAFKFFEEFSDWRFGIMRYVQQLYLEQGITLEQTIPGIINYLVESSEIKVAAVRFIASEAVTSQMKGGHHQHYDILAIYLK